MGPDVSRRDPEMIVATWSSTMSVYYRLIRIQEHHCRSENAISIRTDVFDSARRDDRAKLVNETLPCAREDLQGETVTIADRLYSE